MDGISCDRCGEGLLLEENVRYLMDVEIRAAYDPMEITREDLEGDLKGEMARTIRELEDADPEELQRQVYYKACFDLCGRCRRQVMADPLFKGK